MTQQKEPLVTEQEVVEKMIMNFLNSTECNPTKLFHTISNFYHTQAHRKQQSALTALQAELKEAREENEKLKEFVHHDPRCKAFPVEDENNEEYKCDCGLTELLQSQSSQEGEG